MNKTLLVGRLSKDPELKYTQSGTAVCNFTVAVNRRTKNAEGNYDADFISCTAWNKTAEFVGQYFTKGQTIGLEGRIQNRSYDAQDGSKRFVTEVVAEQVEFVGSKPQNENKASQMGQEIDISDAELADLFA